MPVLLRASGASLTQIGLLSTLSLPWALKFLWAPAVDRFGSRRHWIAGSQLGLALVLLLMAWSGAAIGPAYFGLLLALVALSATQDIAVDAYTIELMDRSELGPANGARVTAYRFGWIVAGGVLVARVRVARLDRGAPPRRGAVPDRGRAQQPACGRPDRPRRSIRPCSSRCASCSAGPGSWRRCSSC